MAKKKNLTKDQLISLYMESLLDHGKQPSSVYSFAKDNNFDESLFYQHYTSFKTLEQGVFKAFFDQTMTMLHASNDYASYDSRNRLLSFQFTFFELLTANRSYVVHALEHNKSVLKSLEVLKELKHAYIKFIDELDLNLPNIKQETLSRIQTKSVSESAWMQLLITLKFWLDDTSSSFEKTDVFIEKSVHASFDLMDFRPLKSVLDFGKFLVKEKFQYT
ncbi:TetR family transcriptional regulator C-terminal domain-containing protein [Ichthyenterobacterium sp. W332]|uniref:TetR family transcriptional regulator C-terminal domain-containing protein n=1 Tax=Microcosmobacter mediterraneus TaxID=3075607 RepID=A0ABU2YIW2_9FLAO|nr:TetR family transcriptional regulator C-terminal domain-containing protein [Ichthyenterobacterium sp. W332]MDT0557609.1 TetR family transcriptional regulator C-terminal domain-containing protein [Ichthyenterobacterium sp. W332]